MITLIKQVILGLFLLVALPASAAIYSVSPPIIDLELEKRDIVYREVTITNHDNRKIRIFPSVNEVNLDDNGSIESFVPPSMTEDRTSSVTSWIQVSRKRIEVNPGESVTVPVTFKVHPDVEPGEYHAVIGFGEGSKQPQAHRKIMDGIAPVAAVRIGVDRVQSEFLRLERFVVERFITDNEDGKIRYSLKNPGSDPVTPAGEIIFYSNSGEEVATTPVNPEGLQIEPGKSIEIIDNAPEELGMGKYKAFLSVEFGKHLTASIHDTTFFYVLPLGKLIAAFLIVLAFSVIIALYVHHRYDKASAAGADMVTDVPLFIKDDRSAEQEHDISLPKSKKE